MSHERASNTQADVKNAASTISPRRDLLKCMNNSGSTRSLTNGAAPDKRSGHATSAHNMPATASTTSAIGSAAAGIAPTCRSDPPSSVNVTAMTHSGTSMEVADVDHGKEMTTAAAR